MEFGDSSTLQFRMLYGEDTACYDNVKHTIYITEDLYQNLAIIIHEINEAVLYPTFPNEAIIHRNRTDGKHFTAHIGHLLSPYGTARSLIPYEKLEW